MGIFVSFTLFKEGPVCMWVQNFPSLQGFRILPTDEMLNLKCISYALYQMLHAFCMNCINYDIVDLLIKNVIWTFSPKSKCFLNTVIRIESKHEVTILGGLNEFIVKFYGPTGSEYIFNTTSNFFIQMHIVTIPLCTVNSPITAPPSVRAPPGFLT